MLKLKVLNALNIETNQGQVLPIDEYFVENMITWLLSKLNGSVLSANPLLNPYTREPITEELLKNQLLPES
jgi:hypothetical protein